ncbi:Ig-like domain-containing protein [Sneathiella marina]|uniref:Ig-like domain-containing protein n=1 Tax=Sneathiella marina TaxID=2950108 RepID=A0ABY4VXR8_9PROT|nr:Ig-like domain-containing protein [Sneathiella marina]USG59727.1 Ig-like domain-containing protein [Sneathiella marina]
MRVFGILAVLLLIVAGVFLYIKGGNLFSSDEEGGVPKQSAISSESPQADTTAPDRSNDTTTDTKPADKKASATGSTSTAQIVDKKLDTSEDEAAQKMAAARPSFDVVRVDQNCEILIAGRGVPNSMVTIVVGGNDTGEVKTSARGEWVFSSTKPLPSGSQTVNLIAKNPDGRELESGKLVVMNVPDCTKPLTERAPAIAMLAPKEGNAETDGQVKLLQVPAPVGDLSEAKGLSLGAVNYGDAGNLELSGKGKPGNTIQVYVNNRAVGSAVVDADGNWSMRPDHPVPAGTYKLRIDQLDPTGTVVSRVELPFQRAPASDVILAQENGKLSAIVQPGNSLWRIARRVYGEGTEYTVIYQANQDQIRNPHLIFPGQIFKLPSKD